MVSLCTNLFYKVCAATQLEVKPESLQSFKSNDLVHERSGMMCFPSFNSVCPYPSAIALPCNCFNCFTSSPICPEIFRMDLKSFSDWMVVIGTSNSTRFKRPEGRRQWNTRSDTRCMFFWLQFVSKSQPSNSNKTTPSCLPQIRFE